jgi:carbamate kinase
LTTVVALGETIRGTAAEQLADLRERIADLADTLAGDRVIVTFGIGPQLEAELARQEAAVPEAPRLPLYVGIARAQAELAELVTTELRPVAGRPVVCLQLHVLVEPDGGAPRAFRGAPAATPLELVARDQVRALLDTGAIVVLGPGIPVTRRGEGLRGVEAVVNSYPLLAALDREPLET